MMYFFPISHIQDIVEINKSIALLSENTEKYKTLEIKIEENTNNIDKISNRIGSSGEDALE